MRILLVSAHADDAEISCGGTVSRLRRDFDNVIWSVYFCPCVEDPNTGNTHLEEHRKAVRTLEIDKLIEYTYPVNHLEEYKQEVRDKLWKIRQDFNPDVVLCPSIHDLHQDHKVVAECCLTIFRDTSTILGFEVLRSSGPDFKANFFIILDVDDVLKKIKAIECYEDQLSRRSYFFDVDRIVSQMRMRGTQVRDEYAEAYELLWGRIA